MEPKIIIHCKGEAELRNLLGALGELGYKWNGDGAKAEDLVRVTGNYIHVFDNEYGKVLQYSNSCPSERYIEFSGLGSKYKDKLKAILSE